MRIVFDFTNSIYSTSVFFFALFFPISIFISWFVFALICWHIFNFLIRVAIVNVVYVLAFVAKIWRLLDFPRYQIAKKKRMVKSGEKNEDAQQDWLILPHFAFHARFFIR